MNYFCLSGIFLGLEWLIIFVCQDKRRRHQGHAVLWSKRPFTHAGELDWSEIDLSQKRSECERSEWTEIDLNESEIDLNESEIDLNESEIDVNECEYFLKANLDLSEIDLTGRSH